jgi:hypothetical protein
MAEVLTGPMAVIKVNGQAVGKMKDIRVNETFRRQPVKGLGQLYADEMPVLDFEGTVSCSYYNIDLKKAMLAGSITRSANDVEEFTANLLLQEKGVQLDILQRVKVGTNPDGSPKVGFKTYCSIRELFLNRQSFNISEGQISGRDEEFNHTSPIIVPR